VKTAYDVEDILVNWDAEWESRKANFMEYLFELYKPADRTYTGLWQRFKDDLADFYRDYALSLPPSFGLDSCEQ